MGRRAIAFFVAALAGCSFVDDFDKFRTVEEQSQEDAGQGDATGQTRNDAATPVRDSAMEDSGPVVAIDSSVADSAVVDSYVPPPACGGSLCDSGDPCLRGTCEGSACVYKPIDADGDGYSPGVCKAGSTAKGGDCNDDDKAVHPGATEVCDEIDNNCNGTKDDGFTKLQCFPDLDKDGFANLDGTPVAACTACPAATLVITDRNDRSKHDCWDDPATRGDQVYPGNLGFDTDGYGPGGKNERKWDFNCDGKVEPQYEVLEGCAGLLGLICDSAMGFVDELPVCGESGKFQMCRQNTLTCSGSTDTKKQGCR